MIQLMYRKQIRAFLSLYLGHTFRKIVITKRKKNERILTRSSLQSCEMALLVLSCLNKKREASDLWKITHLIFLQNFDFYFRIGVLNLLLF